MIILERKKYSFFATQVIDKIVDLTVHLLVVQVVDFKLILDCQIKIQKIAKTSTERHSLVI